MTEFQADADGALLWRTDGRGISSIRLNRPDKKNALTLAMWQALAERVRALSQDRNVRVITLAGAGDDFCAGADIAEFETVRRDAATARQYEAANSAAFAAIREAPVPTIASIDGICFGGGFGIAAACDIRLATAHSRFSVPAARLGLAYPQDAMADIVHAVGAQMARYLTYTAGRLDAEQALRAGFFIEMTASADELAARVDAIATTIAANAPLSVRASKAAIRSALTLRDEDAALARNMGDVTFDSEDYAEGRAAFRERRTPDLHGR